MVLMVSSSLCPDITHAILAHSWALESNAFRLLLSAADRELPKMQARARDAARSPRHGRTAVIPIRGLITAHPKALAEGIGWTISGPTIVNAIEGALEDSEVDAVVLDIDSPGGMVSGTFEAAESLSAMRDAATKPVVAVSSYMMASGAYWLASAAAHEIVSAPTALTGSIGVLAIHEDASGRYEQMGVRLELVTAGRFKAEGNDTEPLSDDGRQFMQSQVDYAYGLFVSAVASARGATASEVMKGYGQGRALTARAAETANLVDRVASIGATIARLQSPQARASVRRRFDGDDSRAAADDLSTETPVEDPGTGVEMQAIDPGETLHSEEAEQSQDFTASFDKALREFFDE